MTSETWEMRTLEIGPYQGTVIFGHNNGSEKRIFVRSNYYTTLYIRLWCDKNTYETAEVNGYGIAGILVPTEYRHKQVQIGTSIDGKHWSWTVHDYHEGTTY